MMQKQIMLLIRKEIWEHKASFIVVPLTISLVMFLLVSAGVFLGLGAQISSKSGIHIFANFQQDLVNLDESGFPQIGQMFVSMIYSPYFFVGSLVQLFYFLACLYDERRDRSVIFWRSLPVSDFSTVTLKLITGAVLVPVIFLSFCTLTTFIILLFNSITLFMTYGESVWQIWYSMEIGSRFIEYWVALIPYALWLSPIYCWLMITSVMANKAPLLWALLPWLALVFFEKIMNITGMWPPELLGISTRISEYYNRKALLMNISSSSIWNTNQVLDGYFWVDGRHLIALICGVIFFLTTVWLRKYRNEAI